jgi:hypothetical protein
MNSNEVNMKTNVRVALSAMAFAALVAAPAVATSRTQEHANTPAQLQRPSCSGWKSDRRRS